tara:strand:- start:9220 stop:11655 length:2436 start_codon:yes stop_codon:yes gene_type:complete
MSLGNFNAFVKSGFAGAVALVIILLTLSACDTPEEKAQAHFEAGMAFVEEGNFVKAGIEFRNALQLNENFADGWYGLALVEEHEGNFRKYAGDILKVIEINPRHLPAQVRYGKIMLLSGELEKALEVSDLVSELAPGSAEALALKSAVMFRLGDKSGAVAAAKAALAADPSNIDAVLVLAAEEISTGTAEAAVKIIDEGLVHNKGNAQLQIVKIRALEELGRNEDVVRVFQELIQSNPEDITYRKSLVHFYLQHGRKEEAEKEIRNIAKENPADANANLDVIRFVRTVKGDEAAAAELESLIEEHPDVLDYRFALATLAELTGDDERAMVILGSIIDKEIPIEDMMAAYNKLAQLYFSNGDFEEARYLAYDVLEMDSSNTDALILIGAIEIDEGKIDSAISNLRSSMRQQPQSVRASLLLGKAHEINGSLELAEDRYAAAYRFSKEEPKVGIIYAQFFLRHGELQRAERILEKLSERHPENADVLKLLAEIMLKKNDWIAADDLAGKLRALDATDSDAYQISGAALAGLQNPEDSRLAYEKAYEITPDAGTAIKALVESYLLNGEIEKARSFLSSVMEKSPNNYLAKTLLARIEFQNNRTEAGEKLIREAIAGAPTEPSGYAMLARHYLEKGQVNKAEAILKEGLEVTPDGFLLNITQAGLLESEGKIPEAIAIYERLIEERPNSEIVANNLASLIAETSNNEEDLRRAYTLAKRFRNSKVPNFLDTLGWVHYRLGEYDMATPLLRRAVELDPNMALLRYHFGMSLKAENNRERAIRELEKALVLGGSQQFAKTAEVEKALEELKAASKTN